MAAPAAGWEVFISYSRQASAVEARALAEALGSRAYFDVADVEAGEQVPSGIVDALLGARVVVVFAEPTYFRRWYCLRELDVALAAFNALVERGAPPDRRAEALEPVVVAVGTEHADELRPLPAAGLRATNWCPATDTAALVALVERRLGTVTPTVGERLAGLSELVAVRETVLEESAVPPARSLAGIPRYFLPGELRVSIGDAFVGRADELWRIHHQLSTLRGDITAAALTGALEGGGGFGKTRLATEYVHRFGRGYRGGVFWVNADGDDRLEEQLHGILSTLVPDTPPLLAMREAGRDVAREAGTALADRTGPPVLYVVDNVPEPGPDVAQRPLTTWCPAMGDVALLVTSRAHQSVIAGIRSLRGGATGARARGRPPRPRTPAASPHPSRRPAARPPSGWATCHSPLSCSTPRCGRACWSRTSWWPWPTPTTP